MAQVAGKPKSKSQDNGVKKPISKKRLKKEIWRKVKKRFIADVPRLVSQVKKSPELLEKYNPVVPITMVNEEVPLQHKRKRIKSKKAKSPQMAPSLKIKEKKKKKKKSKKLKALNDVKVEAGGKIVTESVNVKLEQNDVKTPIREKIISERVKKKKNLKVKNEKNVNSENVKKKKKEIKNEKIVGETEKKKRKIKDEKIEGETGKKKKKIKNEKIVGETEKKKKKIENEKIVGEIKEKKKKKVRKSKKERDRERKFNNKLHPLNICREGKTDAENCNNSGNNSVQNKSLEEIADMNAEVKSEPKESEDISSDSVMIFDNPEVKNEPPDSDDADGSGPEGSDFKNEGKESKNLFSGESLTFYTYNTESGEVKIKTEPGIQLPGDGINNSLNSNEAEKKEEFLVCFKNFIKGTEETKIKELSYTVLGPNEIIEFFLVKDRKKRFGFLKVASKEALEKILKLDGWAVDGRIIRVQKSNLINVTKDPPVKTNLDLKPPKPKKRKIEETDCDVVEETTLEKWRGDILSKVKKNIEKEDDDDGDGDGKFGNKFSAYLKNINPQTSNEQVRSFVESIVAPNQISRFYRPSKRNIAFVDLASKESLERVLKLNGSKLLGRKITVEISTGSQRKTEEESSKSGEHRTGKRFRKFKKSLA